MRTLILAEAKDIFEEQVVEKKTNLVLNLESSEHIVVDGKLRKNAINKKCTKYYIILCFKMDECFKQKSYKFTELGILFENWDCNARKADVHTSRLHFLSMCSWV